MRSTAKTRVIATRPARWSSRLACPQRPRHSVRSPPRLPIDIRRGSRSHSRRRVRRAFVANSVATPEKRTSTTRRQCTPRAARRRRTHRAGARAKSSPAAAPCKAAPRRTTRIARGTARGSAARRMSSSCPNRCRHRPTRTCRRRCWTCREGFARHSAQDGDIVGCLRNKMRRRWRPCP